MKLNKFTVMGVFALLVIALFSLAVNAGLSVTDTYSSSIPTFGSDTQEASNPEHDNEEDRIVYDESTITINNSDTNDITGITSVSFSLSSSGYDLIGSEFDLADGFALPSTIPSGESTIDLKAKIPKDLDAVNSDSEEVAFKVGKLTMTFSNATEDFPVSFDVYMQRENKLIIDDLDAEINDKDRENNIDDGDDIKDLKPGDKIQLFTKVESRYNSRDEIDVEDVELDFECDPEDDLDIEDDNIDVGDLGPDDDSDETLALDIEEDAQDDTITCTLSTSGVDENGATHGGKIEFSLEIERKSHDVVIKDIRLSPTALTCEDSSFQVAIDLINLGKRDEDEAAVSIQSIALGINEKIPGIVLDEDDSITETFVFSVSPEDLKEGKYALQVLTFYDNTKQVDTEVVQIENLCTAFSGNGDDTQEEEDDFVPSDDYVEDAINLDESVLTAEAGKLVSLKVQLTNSERFPVDYRVSLEDLGEFATSTSTKTLHLNPGQTSTVFLNMKTNEDAEEGGMYSANVVLTDANTGATLDTQTFTVEIAAEQRAEGPGLDFGNFTGSTALYVAINIILVVIAIFLIVLIFRGSGRKRAAKKASATPKKLADFEPAPKRRRK